MSAPDDIAEIESACSEFEKASKGSASSATLQGIAETYADLFLAPGIRKLIAHVRQQDAALTAKDEVIARKDAVIAELVEALEATVPPESLGDGWWCPECRAAIDGASVTNGERCTGCGTALTDCQPTGERLAKSRAALARAKGEKS